MKHLKKIYKPIEGDLKKVNELIEFSVNKQESKTTRKVVTFLLASPGKRIRSALAILSSKAASSHKSQVTNQQLTSIASSVELIHMASLLHDDVIDHSGTRHNKPTVNSRWGKDVAIALGDYLYAVAFELVSRCGNPDVIKCISQATKAMCEGELIQVCERDNLDLLKERYLIIVRKKTASLFAASCQTGALISRSSESFYNALKEYGLNFGMAFQIIDDYLDLVGEEKKLGKKPGQDLDVGEFTLPVLNLLESVPINRRKNLRILLASRRDNQTLRNIKSMLFSSKAALKTKETISSYINLAREKLDGLPNSIYKESLISLSGFILDRGFSGHDSN